MAEATYLNEFRKNIFSKVSLEYRDLFKKIARLAGSQNWRDCFYLMPGEMADILEGKTINLSKIVKERRVVGRPKKRSKPLEIRKFCSASASKRYCRYS